MLALGKLGGVELNHSSDVDLIFIYGEEGDTSSRLSHHQWFSRLAEKILETFSAPDPEGPLWRLDLRLRPEGSAGPLVRSLESMENYYAGFGETWERLALIKARGICGSRELVYEFLRQHQPFIYPRSPTPDLLDEIVRIKRRIERDVVGAKNLERDVKLGRGGIREIEFVVQTLQFIHGGRHAFLQETSTLAALTALAKTPAHKAKTSVTLSGNLLKVIDGLAGESRRSAWIEQAVVIGIVEYKAADDIAAEQAAILEKLDFRTRTPPRSA